MAKIEGGCSCGKVRYSSDADPVFQCVCHCKPCQKITGASFSLVVAVPRPSLTVTGNVKVYDGKGELGTVSHKGFCPDCGSPVTHTADPAPGTIMIRAGTLDDATWLKPTMEIFCDSKMPWVSLDGVLQSFPKMGEFNALLAD
jgi:hypothetical protein